MKNVIDQKLRDWAAEQRPSAEQSSRLTASVLKAWQQKSRLPKPRPRNLSPVVWTGIAATLAAALIAVFMLPQASSVSSLDTLLSSERKSFQDDITRITHLFQEAETLFDNQLHWLSQSEHTTELGLAATPPTGDAFTLRFTLLSRSHDNGGWQRIWSTDLVAHDDDYLEITPDSSRATTISLWMHRLKNNQLFVESHLQLDSPRSIQTATSEVLSFGEVHTAARITDNNTEYLLLQTATPIPCSS